MAIRWLVAVCVVVTLFKPAAANEDPIDELPSNVLESLNKGPLEFNNEQLLLGDENSIPDYATQRRLLEEFHERLALARIRAAQLSGDSNAAAAATAVYRVTATVPAIVATDHAQTDTAGVVTRAQTDAHVAQTSSSSSSTVTTTPTPAPATTKNASHVNLLRQRFHRLIGHRLNGVNGTPTRIPSVSTSSSPSPEQETADLRAKQQWERLRQRFHNIVGHRVRFGLEDDERSEDSVETTTGVTPPAATVRTTDESTSIGTVLASSSLDVAASHAQRDVAAVAPLRTPVDFKRAGRQLSEFVSDVRFEESEALRQALAVERHSPGGWLVPYYLDAQKTRG